MKKLTLLALGMMFAPIAVEALNPAQPLSKAPPMNIFQEWAKPIDPFEIAPQVWYVGTKNLTSILLTTDHGHILIDAGLNESALQIKKNIETIGFDVKDIKYILNSHARLDQAGGIALLKELSGAKVVSNKINAQQLKLGGAEDFALGDALLFPPVDTDIELLDNESFVVGNIVITALFTPGHLPGSTSWKITLKNDDVLIYADSLATPDYFLKNNLNYPEIVEDLKYSQNVLANQKVDIFIASKGDRFNLVNKLNKLNNGDKFAFYDSEGLKEYIEKSKLSLIKQLEE
ncbi:HARLDQ motif MBL-fold protein [Proteus hauseri]|uniref:HARLDQ motif MBL-fold protein n=1 Tax=Proteus hauseri TaxID=183417 RepID=UPI001009541D|nr:HARLDQ motif MBL-fold protein [Proteus hauseri]QAV24589.1 MBL fold protein [Proteus hauseri]